MSIDNKERLMDAIIAVGDADYELIMAIEDYVAQRGDISLDAVISLSGKPVTVYNAFYDENLEFKVIFDVEDKQENRKMLYIEDISTDDLVDIAKLLLDKERYAKRSTQAKA